MRKTIIKNILQITTSQDNEFIFKEYLYYAPFDHVRMKDRLDFFVSISGSDGPIPDLHWQRCENIIRTSHSKVNRLRSTKRVDLKVLLDFADALDQCLNFEYPHGDINRKNIIYDGDKLWLIDIEPVIRFDNNNRIFLRSTPPYIHPIDIENERLTILTDLLGFSCYAAFLMGLVDKPHLGLEAMKKINLNAISEEKNPFSSLIPEILATLRTEHHLYGH